jgi:hypothetical protein
LLGAVTTAHAPRWDSLGWQHRINIAEQRLKRSGWEPTAAWRDIISLKREEGRLGLLRLPLLLIG